MTVKEAALLAKDDFLENSPVGLEAKRISNMYPELFQAIVLYFFATGIEFAKTGNIRLLKYIQKL